MEKLPAEVRDAETFAVIGAAMEVHRELGSGFLEAVYQQALEHELGIRGVPFSSQVQIPVRYKGHALECGYRADLVCYGTVIVELKTVDQLGRHDEAQLINYLKATGIEKGLLLNFRTSSLQYRRLIYSSATSAL